jgi:hypothetical protein
MPRSATIGWIKVNIFYPVAPVLLLGLLKYVLVAPTPFWKAISSADVALSMGIFSVFLVQAILTKEVQLEDAVGKQIRYGFASEFQFYTLLSFFLFIAISTVEDLVQANQLSEEIGHLRLLDLCVAVSTIVTVIRGVQVQRTFNLLVS